ncbi:MAG: septum formation initiator family protein [Candidatus Poribacteria bacterium]|jgi:cell division protein FtsB
MPRLSAPRWTTVASAALGLLLAICLYRFGDDVRQYKSAQALKSEAQAELALLEARRDDTRELAERLRSDPMTKERLARAEGYSRPGETVYIITPAKTPTSSAATAPAQ